MNVLLTFSDKNINVGQFWSFFYGTRSKLAYLENFIREKPIIALVLLFILSVFSKKRFKEANINTFAFPEKKPEYMASLKILIWKPVLFSIKNLRKNMYFDYLDF